MTGPVPLVRLVLADGHPIFRDGLRRLIETDPRLLVVSEAGKRASTIALVQESAPDVLLLGLTTSDQNALETLRELASSKAPVRTIVLTDCVDTPEVLLALQFGARGVILKDSSPEVLFKCIHTVVAGDFWIGRERVADAVVSLRKFQTARRRSKTFGLTPREIEIARAVVAGYTNKEIARRSSISENTVKSHILHIFTKVGASNRVELALFAAHHRVLDHV